MYQPFVPLSIRWRSPLIGNLPSVLKSNSEDGIFGSADKFAAVTATKLALVAFEMGHLAHCLILGFNSEYTMSVRRFTAT